MDITWELKKKKITELKENDKNPRSLSKEDAEQLEKSISKFGVCEPIVANTDGMIIGGHQRVRILKKLGHKEVEVYVPAKKLTEEEANELNIRLNKNTGEFDYDILANSYNIDDLVYWGFDLKEFGFSNDDLENEINKKDKKKKKVNICPSCGMEF